MESSVRRRHRLIAVALLAFAAVQIGLLVWGGHRGAHVARDLVVPGGGSIDQRWWLGVAFVVATVGATVVWLRWGADWLLVVVVVAAAVTTWSVTSTDTSSAAPTWRPVAAAHEFPLVVLVIGFLSWLRSVLVSVPGLSRLTAGRAKVQRGLDDLAEVGVVDRARALAVLALAEPEEAVARRACLERADVQRRARRVGAVARWRFGGDPLRRDHAHVRAARLLCRLTGQAEADALAADGARTAVGVACSEPTWVRPLDAVLAATALDRCGKPAGASLEQAFSGMWRLHGTHRPAWCWTPAAVCAGRASPWEHTAVTAIARWQGWIHGDDDWRAVRRAALGAAARGTRHRDDERLVAAARVWLTFVDDPEAERILQRPTVRRDPLAVALDRLAVTCRGSGLPR